MIQTKEQLCQCLAADRECYRDGRRGWRWMLDLLLARERTVIWRYVRLMRRCDYYTTNRRRSPWHALMYLWYQRRHNRRSVELGLIVGCGAFGPGLCIYTIPATSLSTDIQELARIAACTAATASATATGGPTAPQSATMCASASGRRLSATSTLPTTLRLPPEQWSRGPVMRKERRWLECRQG